MELALSHRIIVFVKYPQPGKVKSRLAIDIGVQKATQIYRAFVEDTLGKFSSGQYPVTVFFTPADKEKLLREWLGNAVDYCPQTDGDLGLKMQNAFETVFAGNADKTILIGTDIPQLPTTIIQEAFSFLDSNDVVLGPSDDGGYYLIGFRKESFETSVFDRINWRGPDVFDSTMDRINRLNRNVGLLEALTDIDTLEDLETLKRNISGLDQICPKTYPFLAET